MQDSKTIIEALNVIKSECKAHDTCALCPLFSHSYGECNVSNDCHHYPMDWQFNKPVPIWNAFDERDDYDD